MKTYKCKATITLNIDLDVDAGSEKEARHEANKTLKMITESLPKHTDNIKEVIVDLQVPKS